MLRARGLRPIAASTAWAAAAPLLLRRSPANVAPPPLLTQRRWQSSSSSSGPTAPATTVRDADASNPFSAMPDGANYERPDYDPWDVLGLKKGASMHDMRIQYHLLTLKYHPDHAKDPKEADMVKFNEIDRAYQIITKAPTLDKRYRAHVTETQFFYYKFLPEWMARNVDEMPRWWSWLKWRSPRPWIFACMIGFLFYWYAMFARWYPYVAGMISVAFLSDVLLHTQFTPLAFTLVLMKWLMMRGSDDMAFLTSPKGFLRRDLKY